MDLQAYEPGMAEMVAAGYARAVEAVPHCYAVTPAEVAAAVADPGPGAGKDPPLESLQALVAAEGGRTLGFVDAGIWPAGDARPATGVIRMLWYDPGRRGAGQLLLEAAEDHLRGLGAAAIEAFHDHYTYPFYYVDSAFLSDRLGHVAALLAMNGYRKAHGEVLLDWPDFDLPAPAPSGVPAEVSVQRRPSPGRLPEIDAEARLDGTRIGLCRIVRIADYAADERAGRWCFVHWLDIDGKHQGRNLGKHLLGVALCDARAAGYRHAAISTAWDNHRAFLFYSNFGFAVSDWTYGWRREL